MSAALLSEIDDVFDELNALLKSPDASGLLAERGVNMSLALTLADGLHAYLKGDKDKALLELGTAIEEIASRMARSRGGDPS